MNDLRGLKEQIKFRYSNIPDYTPDLKTELQKIKESDPALNFTRYHMGGIHIDKLPWKAHWKKTYEPGKDPSFSYDYPYETGETHLRENIIQENGKAILLLRPDSGAVLRSNFTFKYGIVKAYMKLPTVKGAWSAFWLYGASGMPEMDIFEHCGDWLHKVSVTHHFGYDYKNIRGKKMTVHNKRFNKNFNPNKEYYLYEIEVTPYAVYYRINGLTVRTMKKGIPSGENHIIVNITKGNYCPNNNIPISAQMEVKWIDVIKY